MTELGKIKASYEKGELDGLKSQLLNFVKTHKAELLRFKAREEELWQQPLDMATAVKLLLLHVRSIDVKAEMHDQIKAMKAARGRRQDLDDDAAFIAWIREHSPGWRGFRVLAFIYVFERNREQLLSAIN
jgi:hypothetical protein